MYIRLMSPNKYLQLVDKQGWRIYSVRDGAGSWKSLLGAVLQATNPANHLKNHQVTLKHFCPELLDVCMINFGPHDGWSQLADQGRKALMWEEAERPGFQIAQ